MTASILRAALPVALALPISLGAHAQISPDARSQAIPTASPTAQADNAQAPQAHAAAIEACTEKTEALLAALDRGDYAAAENDFSPTMRTGLTTAQLKQGWESLPQKFGQPGARGAPVNSLSGGYTVITVPMPFQNGKLAAQVACGVDGHIAGFHAMLLPPAPAPSTSTPPPSASSTPASSGS